MRRILTMSLLLGGLLASLPGCTPAASTTYTWEVINHTADTLVIAAQLEGDSFLVTRQTQLDTLRRQVAIDTLPSGQPIVALTRHHNQWYYFYSRSVSFFPPIINTPALSRYDAIKHVGYTRLPPGVSCIVLEYEGGHHYEPYKGPHTGGSRFRLPFINSMRIISPSASFFLKDTAQFEQAFRQEETGRETQNESAQLYQLTIEPGLLVRP